MKLNELKIYLLSHSPRMAENLSISFEDLENVEALCMDFSVFMDTIGAECVVSPANSYGLMDGGYDLAISEWFGWDLQEKVQRYIISHFYGEQPVGTSFCIDTGKKGIKLIHTPSMRYPEPIRDRLVIYQCMRTCLMCAMENGIRSIVIPAFGALTGRVPQHIVSDMMRRAYDQLAAPPNELGWAYADASHFRY